MRDVPAGPDTKPNGPPIRGDLPEPVPTAELRKLQLVELDILREFVRVCEAHGLRYYLAYGTLLGAVRHRGFIPWDDDVDVTMPRSDYVRLAKLCAAELGPELIWQSYLTDEHYPHLFGKLLMSGTVLQQSPAGHMPFRQAVYIDVFPLDGGARSWWAKVLQRLTIRVCRLRLGADFKRRRVKRILAQTTRVIPRRWAIAAFETMTRAFPADGSRGWISAGGPYGYHRESFPTEWFGLGATQLFEGDPMIGPTAADEYLTHLYGEYMTLPPITARVSHHGVTKVDLAAARPGVGKEDYPADQRID
jgi:lipopolysaccharide cholinephosphotransferase